MRRSHVIALVITTLVSSAATVQAQTPAQTQGARAEGRGLGRGMEGRPGRGALLRGVKLSDAEKGRVKEIHAKYQTESEGLRESLRPAMESARAARQKGDTVAARAAFDRTKGDREKMRALKEREQSEIRAALTLENQKLFDARKAEMAQRRAEWSKDGAGRGAGHRGGRKG